MTETAAHGAHAAAGHAASHASSHAHPEVTSWVQLLARAMAPSPASDFLLQWEKVIFMAIIVVVISTVAIAISRRSKMIPGRGQAFAEILVSGLDDVVRGVIGARGRKYTPFLGSLFIYIFVSNLIGLIPLQNSIMAFLTTTVPIALCVFLYVQWVGITQNGIGGYLYHLCGSPKDIFGWGLVVLMLPLHIMGEFIKPLSLSFRLYGNIMAGHILLAVFMTLGIQMLAPLHLPFGVPFHFPFLFLELLVSAVQAFVFTLLSTIYIAMMLPHEHEHEHAHEAHGESGHEHAPEAAH